MNQVYKKNEYVVFPVSNNYIVLNTEKVFKDGHTHVNEMGLARLLIDLAIKKQLPKNPYYVDRLIRIAKDKDYIGKLKEFKQDELTDYKELMKHDSYKRIGGAIRQVKRE